MTKCYKRLVFSGVFDNCEAAYHANFPEHFTRKEFDEKIQKIVDHLHLKLDSRCYGTINEIIGLMKDNLFDFFSGEGKRDRDIVFTGAVDVEIPGAKGKLNIHYSYRIDRCK